MLWLCAYKSNGRFALMQQELAPGLVDGIRSRLPQYDDNISPDILRRIQTAKPLPIGPPFHSCGLNQLWGL